MSYAFWLLEPECREPNTVGAKAARLATLAATGFMVPDGFCLSHLAYCRHIAGSGAIASHEPEGERQPQAIRESIQNAKIDAALRTEILNSYAKLQKRYPGPVAVRSSSTAEDLVQHSFAGLYETVLDVSDEQALLEAIRRCWASYWNEEAVFYRSRLNLDHARHGMAVLVQIMIRPTLAGVLFTQAPVSTAPDTMLVEFVQGDGVSLVGGNTRGERLVIERPSGRVHGVTGSESAIDPSLVRRLFSLGLAVEELQGGPQDIEWCVDKEDRLWILQTRPVTGLADSIAFAPATLGPDWQPIYDEPFSPLGCDLALRRHERWVAAINRYHKATFKAEAKAVDGFLYRTTPWRSPGRLVRSWMGLWKLVRWLQGDWIRRRYEEVDLPTHTRHLDHLAQRDVAAVDDRDLLAGFNTAIELYLELQSTSYPIGAIAVASAGLLHRVCQLLLHGMNNQRSSDFLRGLDNLTVERDLALARLGQELRSVLKPSEVENLDYAGLQAFRLGGATGERFWNKLQTFQETFGYVWADRYPRDPGWKISPEAIAVSLRHAAQADTQTRLSVEHARQKQHRADAIDATARQLSVGARFRLRWRVFRWFLRRAEQCFPHKENRNHHLYYAVMVIQKYAREIGHRLHVRRVLQAEDDLFFLTWKQIQQVLSSGSMAAALQEQVRSRKVALHAGLRQAVRQGQVACQEDSLSILGESGGFSLAGEPCSPGVGAGIARIVNGFGELQRVGEGDILICRHLRPAYSPVFARVAGIVIEEGSLLSHGATLAREYGIPAVVNVPGVIQQVRDGSSIMVDGERGLVSQCVRLADEISAASQSSVREFGKHKGQTTL